jgi:hypothetical protein
MIRLTDRTAIPASPTRVWRWFVALEAHYRDWHSEHLTWRTIRGTPLTEGAIVFVDQWLGRYRFTGRCRIADVRPDRSFHWEMLFPLALVGVGGSFTLEGSGTGCELIAEVHMGWSVPMIGWLLDRMIGLVVPLRDVQRHMDEEGRNLIRLLETEA